MAWYVAQIADCGATHAVTFPDAPDVRVSAATLEDAISRASETLEWRLESLRAKGIPAPGATPLAAFADRGDSHGAIYALVEIADARETFARAPQAQLRRAANA